MKIDFTELLKAQSELDQVIIGDKKIKNITEKKLVALSVELAELFNEIRCFKYWSNKGPSKKEIILEEYVDVLHFWLSLINEIENKKEKVEIESYKSNVNYEEDYLTMIHIVGDLNYIYFDNLLYTALEEFMQNLLTIATSLNFTEKEIIEAYYRKRDINFKRQQEGY